MRTRRDRKQEQRLQSTLAKQRPGFINRTARVSLTMQRNPPRTNSLTLKLIFAGQHTITTYKLSTAFTKQTAVNSRRQIGRRALILAKAAAFVVVGT